MFRSWYPYFIVTYPFLSQGRAYVGATWRAAAERARSLQVHLVLAVEWKET